MTPQEVDHEKRFAVVMYGGVSLAVYINGVSQELFRLVRSTAPDAGGSEPLSGTEKVYRELAGLLRARFVVDILSGTSAGGINAIFLAKALANGRPMDRLEQLWLDEGDIDVLINDKRSALAGLKAAFAAPRSLLNSRRMYRKLLEALKGMDPPAGKAPAGPAADDAAGLVSEIDLFITATDLQGRRIPLNLSDQVVYEYRHRNVFNFKKTPEGGRNDFGADCNPFLAFAARCTSSFPFAFEPMRLADIEGARPDPKWRRFYPDYLLDPGQVDEKTRSRHAETAPDADGRYDVFTRRAFADGGYLDNKPFSYAVEAIAARRSDVPVDRKLLYIEPSPERVRDELAVLDAPNAVENVVKVFTLARYEAIREDLQAVLNRNRMIERVGRILEGTLDDIQGNPEKREPDSVRQWLDQDLEKMIDREGIGYGGYLRLRVAQLTDDLAEILTRQAGFDAGSDLFQAVREIVRVWRDRRFRYYVDGEKPGDARQSFNRFLQFYNLRFFTSRLRFTLHAIDRLFRLAGEKAVDGSAAFVAEEGWSRPLEVVERVKLEGRAAAFRERLKQIRGELSLRLEAIEQLRARLLHPGMDSELTRGVAQMALSGRKIVAEILEERSTARVRGAIDAFLETHAQALEGVADFIRDVVHRADVHSDLCKHTLGLGVLVEPGREGESPPALRAALENYLREPVLSPRSGVRLETGDGRGRLPNRAPADPRRAAEWAAAFYFRKFPYYDIVAFPMLKSHEIGEEIDPVEVLRISPEDAQALSAAGGRKLGGSTLMHFGAFLDRTWRKNDILWGRLDGAERLITCLLSGTAHEGERERLIADAHRAIFEEVLQETLGPKDPAKVRQRGREMLDLLTASMLGKEPRDRSRVNEKLSRTLTQKEIARMLEGVLKGNLDAERIRDLFRGHQIDRRLEPRPALQAIARSIEVVGRMLEAIAQDFSAQGRGRRAAAWITRVGRLLWGLVEAATPHSLARTFFRHWLVLIMAVAALLALFGSAVSGEPGVGAFGLKVLLLAAVVFGVWSVFQGILAKRFRLLGAMAKSLAALFVLVSLSLAAIGAFRLPGILAGVWDRLKEVFNYLIP